MFPDFVGHFARVRQSCMEDGFPEKGVVICSGAAARGYLDMIVAMDDAEGTRLQPRRPSRLPAKVVI
jgi:hypothetical protein